MDMTEEQWNLIGTILPEDPVRRDKRGRPWSDRRDVLNGVLWILRTGAPWKDLPGRYGKYQTVHRRFQNWVRSGVMEKILLPSRKISKIAVAWIFGSASSTEHLFRRKKGALRGTNQARERHEDHGYCRQPWSSSRHLHRECFPS